MASRAWSGCKSRASQASSKVINPTLPVVHLIAVCFWSISTFRGGVFALAAIAVRSSSEQHNAR